MWLTVTYNNGIVEEFTFGLEHARDFIKRAIATGNVIRIISGTKTIYNSNQEYYNRVESLEFYAQAAKDQCFGSGCITDVGRVTARTKHHNKLIVHNDFIKVQEQAKKLRKEIFENVQNKDNRQELISRCVLVIRVMQSYINANKVITV